MTRADLESLCLRVMDGNLADAAPLYDLLKERGDPRAAELCSSLGLLAEHFGRQSSERAITRSRTPHERAYRMDEAAYRSWRSFAAQFRISFWPELYGPLNAETLGEIGERMDVKRQAERYARRHEDEGGGELLTEGPVVNSVEGDEDQMAEEGEGYPA